MFENKKLKKLKNIKKSCMFAVDNVSILVPCFEVH